MIEEQSDLKSIAKLRQERVFFLTLVFTILLFNLEEYFFQGRHVFFLIYAFFEPNTATAGLGESVSTTAGVLSISALLISIYIFWVTFKSTKRLKYFYFSFFSLAIFAQFGLWNAVRRLSHSADFYTWLSSPSDLWFDSFKLFFDPNAFILITIYGLFLFFIQPTNTTGYKGALTIGGLIIGLGLGSNMLSAPNFATFSVPSFYKSMAQAAFSQSNNNISREPIISQNDLKKPQQNVVFIIDESIRAPHLSLHGYERQTTPYLENLERNGNLIFWEDAISSSTCSALSNAVLMSGISSFPDKEKRVYRNPTIFHYAKAMGYTTHYLDGSSSQLWNGLKNDDLLYIDSYMNRSDLEQTAKHQIDFLLAEHMHQILTEQSGQFIVINKVGVHFPYASAYPANEVKWQDAPPRTDKRGLKELINHYNNGLFYNSENFFDILMPDLAPLKNTTILYTSDHGQDLGEISGLWSHCGRSIHELHVPLLIIADDVESLQSVDTTLPVHHFNIFPTLLDLLEVPADMRPVDYAPSLFALPSQPQTRYYLPGYEDIFLGEPILFEKPIRN